MLSLQLFATREKSELAIASQTRLSAISEHAKARLEAVKASPVNQVVDETGKLVMDEKAAGAGMVAIATGIAESVLCSAGMAELDRARQAKFKGILANVKAYPSPVLQAAALEVELAAWAKAEPTLFPREYTRAELSAMIKSESFQTTAELGNIRTVGKRAELTANVKAAAACRACMESLDSMGIARKEQLKRFAQIVSAQNKADKLAAKAAAKAAEKPADKPESK